MFEDQFWFTKMGLKGASAEALAASKTKCAAGAGAALAHLDV